MGPLLVKTHTFERLEFILLGSGARCPVVGRDQIRDVGHFDYCTEWLATVDKVRTKLLGLNGDIFIPELAV